ncbi:YlzJ-like family protein [Mesobacillus foraminis]|uniref:YlzJ-like family protein n=1 Tax=Mesobacillus foraminis TaxID=279826 RepID=UPI001BE9D510|nr:YlzJ-like family protein [Mesobacillus foraminis]MBT2755956.1 YlzJ-like family protein [Mesobacillus foraminis]
MILYTMMPQELIYPHEEEKASPGLMVSYNGIPVLAEQEDGFNYRIVRVMSTDPAHFLKPNCTPGTKFSLK